MSDPIWFDTNAASLAVKNNPVVLADIERYRKAGRKLLLVPFSYTEIAHGNPHTKSTGPHPRAKVGTDAALKRLGFEVDTAAGKAPIKTHSNVSYSDAVVLSQVESGASSRGIKAPEIYTSEGPQKGMVTGAPHYGVRAVRPSGDWEAAQKKIPRVSPVDYPEDSNSPLSRFFKDRPFLKKLGLVGAGIGASQLAGAMMDKVEEHYNNAVEKARKEFEKSYPEASELSRRARLDQHKAAYEAALAKLKAPTNAKAVAAVLLAFTKNKDIPAAKRYLDKQLSKVKLASGDFGGYADAASAYINAMADLLIQLEKYHNGLPEIAADIGKRAAVLLRIGNELVKTYFDVAPLTAVSPLLYYQWMDVYNVGSTFQRLGGNVAGFASQINGLANAYTQLEEALDKELLRVSEQLNQYAP